MTGAELNNLGGDFTANKGCIAVIDDGLASVVVLKSSAYLPGANADKVYGYVTDAGTTREDSNGNANADEREAAHDADEAESEERE